MGGVTNGKVLAFGGVEVQLPLFGPDSAAVKGVLENIMAVSGGDEFNVVVTLLSPCLFNRINE